MLRKPALPLPLQFAVAVAALVAGAAAWLSAVNSTPNAIGHGTVVLGLSILLGAFWPLRRLVWWHALAPMRVALTIVVILSLLATMSLPAPLRPESIGSFLLFLVIILLAVTAHLLAAPRPRWSFAALLSLAVIGVYLGYAIDVYATSPRFSALVKGSSWPIATIGMACIAACWHGRRLVAGSTGNALGAAL